MKAKWHAGRGRNLAAIGVLIGMIFFVAPSLLASEQTKEYSPAPKIGMGDSVAPLGDWEVKLFKEQNFIGKWISYSLQPGMRQLLVSELPDNFKACRSIQIGKNVEVTLFRHIGFGSEFIVSTLDVYQSKAATFPIERFQENFTFSPSMLDYDPSDTVLAWFDYDPNPWRDPEKWRLPGSFYPRSLVISPAGQGEIGVLLIGQSGINPVTGLDMIRWKTKEGKVRSSSYPAYRFIALPQQQEIREHVIDNLESFPYLPARALFRSHPDVQVTLFRETGFGGESLSIPSSGAKRALRFGISGSWIYKTPPGSLRVRWTGPITVKGQAPPTKEPVRAKVDAPPTPEIEGLKATGTQPIPMPQAVATQPAQPSSEVSLSGTWSTSLGYSYKISQSGDQFTWEVEGFDEKGAGRIVGQQVTANWHGSRGTGSGKGHVSLDESGNAIRIEWENGVMFFRY